MKKIFTLLAFLAVLLTACGGGAAAEPSEESAPAAASGPTLTVTDGSTEKVYSSEDLQALGAEQASFQDVAYLGVPLKALLQDAGFTPDDLRAVKAKAVDGFSANYEAAQFMADDTLVAYARVDGDLADDELPFRMVLPAEGGSMNVRMLTRIEVIP